MKLNRITASLFLIALLTASFHAQVPTPAATPTEIKIAVATFDAYVGQYQDSTDPDQIFSIFREEGRFYVRPRGGQKIEIFPESDSRFFVKDFPAAVDFVRGSGSKVTSLTWHQGGKDTSLKRIADVPLVEPYTPFTKTEAMIPMRDGVKLHTVILTPTAAGEKLPIIIERTPYGITQYSSNGLNGAEQDLVADGYIFVYQDIRGRYGSEGDFVMLHPVADHRQPKAVDESTDTYDTIDWLVKNVPGNNGRVGIKGVSYDGWLATMALIDPHPALKASSPQAPVADFWLGDDYFHNGAFRMSIGFEYTKAMESSNKFEPVSFGTEDSYDHYLKYRSLAELTADTNGKFPTWNNFVAHPSYDSFWQARGIKSSIRSVSVPTLVVGGWWDQEDLYGAITTYKLLQSFDRQNLVSLVEGPWRHGGWYTNGRTLNNVDFASSTGRYFRKNIQAPWFAYYLKDKGPEPTTEAYIFQSGTNQWRSYDAWPPKRVVKDRDLYFQCGQKLSLAKDEQCDKNTGFDSYVSDPANPVPYRKRPISATYEPTGSGWYMWLAQDQQFLKDRADVLHYETPPLDADTTLTGDIVAHLFASTTGTDSDWVVKLIDHYPADGSKMSGYEFMIAAEIFRGRYLTSFTTPRPLQPNKVNEYTIDLHGNDHVFLKGHRIEVQVQSSWFPLYDRNPQTFVDNIFLAKPSDFHVATQRIYRSTKYPSRVSVEVANALAK
jgi:putative CocE/NonD family hydrolase